jgi:uncharacterized protein (DUF58 family)
MNGKVLTLFFIIFGLLALALVTHIGDLAWLAMPFLAYLGVGILQTPRKEQVHLQARRSVVKSNLGEGGSSISVSVEVRNQGPDTLNLCLSDPLQPGMRRLEGRQQMCASVQAGEAARIQYAFQCPRGRFTWQTVGGMVSDPFGLFETWLELPAAGQVEALPGLKKFRPFPLRPRQTLHMPGAIPGRLGGAGEDFWGVREYHPGDPLRRLDWRRSARHPRQFFTKEFEQEQIADIGLILDARHKTELGKGEDSLYEHSVRAAASLSENFLRQGNRVSLLIYGKEIVSIFPGYGKMQLNRILHALSQPVSEPGRRLDSLQFIPLQMFSSHSLIMVLSPLARDDWRLFPRLCAYGYQVLLISPDPIDYVRAMMPEDPATRLAVRMARVERRLEIGQITRLRIPVIDWQVSRPLAPLVRAALGHPLKQQEAR